MHMGPRAGGRGGMCVGVVDGEGRVIRRLTPVTYYTFSSNPLAFSTHSSPQHGVVIAVNMLSV